MDAVDLVIDPIWWPIGRLERPLSPDLFVRPGKVIGVDGPIGELEMIREDGS